MTTVVKVARAVAQQLEGVGRDQRNLAPKPVTLESKTLKPQVWLSCFQALGASKRSTCKMVGLATTSRCAEHVGLAGIWEYFLAGMGGLSK